MESNDQDNVIDKGLMSSLARFGMGGKPSGYGYPGQGYPPQYPVQAYPPQSHPQGYPPYGGYGYPPPPLGYPPVACQCEATGGCQSQLSAGGYPPVASPYPAQPPTTSPYPVPIPPPYQSPADAGGAIGKPSKHNNTGTMLAGGAVGAAAAYGLHRLFHTGGSHHHHHHGHAHGHKHGHGHHGFFKH